MVALRTFAAATLMHYVPDGIIVAFVLDLTPNLSSTKVAAFRTGIICASTALLVALISISIRRTADLGYYLQAGGFEGTCYMLHRSHWTPYHPLKPAMKN